MPYKDETSIAYQESKQRSGRRFYQAHKDDPIFRAKHIAGIVRCKRMRYYQAVEYLGGCCKDCGYKTNLNALQFDHVEGKKPDEKYISLCLTLSWARLKVELDKCELVCANCHCIRTAIRRGS